MNNDLNELERAAMDALVEGTSKQARILQQQVAKLAVSSRKVTQCGFYTNFTQPTSTPSLNLRSRIIITGVDGSFQGTAVGFILFIDRGYIKMLEGFTFGNDRWPDIADPKSGTVKGTPESQRLRDLLKEDEMGHH